jgi:nitrilase
MMTDSLPKIAAIQINSGDDVNANLNQVEALLAQAQQQGVQLALIPEMFATLDGKQYRTIADDEALYQRIANWGNNYNLWLIAGAYPQPSPDGDPRVSSACLVFDNHGDLKARYNKIHLFDVDVGDAHGSYRESDHFAPGNQVVVVDTPVGKVGLAICYDLRFPQLFMQMRAKGAEIFTLPAAFTHKTGEAHWQSLLRARAIEQQCYVIAANQCGWHDPLDQPQQRQTWGHSQIIDPWGSVLTELEEQPGLAIATIDKHQIQQLRQTMPVFEHRRFTPKD